MTTDSKNDQLAVFRSFGEQKFYRHLLTNAINKLIKIRDEDYSGVSPEIEFLENAEKFLFLYRRENRQEHLDLSRIYRKAAHKIYRIMLKKNMIQTNIKFLNAV